MSTAAQPRPSKSERTRAQILAAAEARFASLGFEKTRLDDVADRGHPVEQLLAPPP